MAAQGLAYYRGGDPSAPIVYEDFLPASAAGHLPLQPGSRLATGDGPDEAGYNADWLAGAIGRHIHDPYVALCIAQEERLITTDALRAQVLEACQATA